MRTAGGSPRPQGTCPHTSKCIHLHEVQVIHLRRMCMDPQVQKRGECKGGRTHHTTHTLPKAQHSKSCMLAVIAGGNPSLADTQSHCTWENRVRAQHHILHLQDGEDMSMKAQPGTHHTTQHTANTPEAGGWHLKSGILNTDCG